jgi:hypothetical protein
MAASMKAMRWRRTDGGLLVSNNAINSEPLLSPRPTEIATSFYQ